MIMICMLIQWLPSFTSSAGNWCDSRKSHILIQQLAISLALNDDKHSEPQFFPAMKWEQ